VKCSMRNCTAPAPFLCRISVLVAEIYHFHIFVEPGRPGLGTRAGRRLPFSGVAQLTPGMGTPEASGQVCYDLLQRIIPQDKRPRHVAAETTLGNDPRAKVLQTTLLSEAPG
jgi:hypothetical protein